MKFYSTKGNCPETDITTAIMKGLAPDGGLYCPEYIPEFESDFFQRLPNLSFPEVAAEVFNQFFKKELSKLEIKEITVGALDFDIPIIQLNDDISVLELFHGPTLAFKDVAARCMARIIKKLKSPKTKLTILVATSGDTGGAVASGFLGVEGTEVIILYPSGQVSPIQEAQLTTMGHNVSAYEVDGTFDDCQSIVKKAFIDEELSKSYNLASANSINIARLIPQSTYYFYAASKFTSPVDFVIPSGNFGNLCGGTISRKMGLKISKLIAAINANDVFLRYINSGEFNPSSSISTLSNAMDIGNPSNFSRILEFHSKSYDSVVGNISAYSFNDEQTLQGIKESYEKYNYTMCPHTAIGYLAAKADLEANTGNKAHKVVLATAHPAKFKATVEKATGEELKIPESLEECLNKTKNAKYISADFETFKQEMLNRVG